MRPHRLQPTRLHRPWDSPGKNTGVGCHFLLQCRKVKVKSLSCVRLLVTPWTAAHQAPPSMGFSRQEYWSGVPLPSPNKQLEKHKKKKTSHVKSHTQKTPLPSPNMPSGVLSPAPLLYKDIIWEVEITLRILCLSVWASMCPYHSQFFFFF